MSDVAMLTETSILFFLLNQCMQKRHKSLSTSYSRTLFKLTSLAGQQASLNSPAMLAFQQASLLELLSEFTSYVGFLTSFSAKTLI